MLNLKVKDTLLLLVVVTFTSCQLYLDELCPVNSVLSAKRNKVGGTVVSLVGKKKDHNRGVAYS